VVFARLDHKRYPVERVLERAHEQEEQVILKWTSCMISQRVDVKHPAEA
jgi:hypothetical protein